MLRGSSSTVIVYRKGKKAIGHLPFDRLVLFVLIQVSLAAIRVMAIRYARARIVRVTAHIKAGYELEHKGWL